MAKKRQLYNMFFIKRYFCLIIAIVCLFAANNSYSQSLVIRSEAGDDTSGFVTFAPLAMKARINAPAGVAVDKKGNFYFSSDVSHIVQKVEPNGHMSIFAGRWDTSHSFYGDGGPATAAGLNFPLGLATDKIGNVYIADNQNFAIRKVDTTGIITTVVGVGGTFGGGSGGDGGPATDATIYCSNLAFDKYGNMYFTNLNYYLRKVDTSGIITTIAGAGLILSSGTYGNGGPATAAAFGNLTGVAVDSNGNIYISDVTNNVVRVIKTNDTIYAFAGIGTAGFSGDNGLGTAAKLSAPMGLAVDNMGYVYVADRGNNRIRRVSIATDSIKTVVGTGTAGFSGEGGSPTSAALKTPNAVTFNKGNMFISDGNNFCIREVQPPDSISITSNYGSVHDTVCAGYSVTFRAAIKHAGYGDTICWVKDTTIVRDTIVTRDTVFERDSVTIDTTFTRDSVVIDSSFIRDSVVIDSTFTWDSTYTIRSVIIGGNDTAFTTSRFGNNDTIKCLLYAPGGGTVVLASNKIIITTKPSPSPITGPSSICFGIPSVTMTDTSSAGHWHVNHPGVASTDSSGNLTIHTTGIDSVTYSFSNGCKVTLILTVNPTPTAISGVSSACYGSTTTLSIADTGGTWVSSNPSIAAVSGSGIVTGDSAGIATISYTFATGCYSAYDVTINPIPSIIAGVTTICANASSTLSDTATGGAWTISSATLATIDSSSGILRGILPGTDTVTYTLPTGCFMTTTITLKIAPPPIDSTLSGITTICRGTSETLHEAFPGGAWSSSDTSIVSITDSGFITGVLNDTTVINYSISDGCLASLTVVVDSVPDPITGVTSVCVGSAITLGNTASGSWHIANSFAAIADSSTGVVTGITPGMDTVVFSITSGCSTSSAITVNPLPPAVTGVDSVCGGASVTLSDSVTGGSWSTTDSTKAIVSSAGVVTGVHTGHVNIVYTLPTGCNATFPFIVRNSPVAFTGSLSVCIGVASTMGDSVSGGHWAISNSNLSFDTSTGIITGLIVGYDSISYTLPSTCGIHAVITINPNPASITGTTSVCPGATTTLYDSTAGGSWLSNDTLSASVSAASGVVTGVSAFTVTITYSLPSGCIAATTFTVNPLPMAITGSGSVCTGLSVTENDSTTGGAWSISSTSVASINTVTGIVTGIIPGTDIIKYTLPVTGCDITTIISVNLNAAPIAGDSVLCQGSQFHYLDSITGGNWTITDSTIISNLGTGDIMGLFPGISSVIYTLPDGCFSSKNVRVNPVPHPILGPDSVCNRTTIHLNDSSAGGIWVSNHMSIASVDSTGMVTATDAGMDTILYKYPATGCYSAKPVFVKLSPAVITGSHHVCTGLTTTLSDSIAGGTWTSSNASAALITPITGIVTGSHHDTTITIKYSLPNGCYADFPFAVLPTPVQITGDTVLCAGSLLTLTDTTLGGIWRSIDSGTASINSSGVVAGILPGYDTVVYRIGYCRVEKFLHIKSTPGGISGYDTICIGASQSFMDSTPGGTWGVSDTDLASVSTAGLATGISPGDVNVHYSMPDGCFASIIAHINPLPFHPSITLKPASNLCTNTMYQNFGTDTSLAGVSYNWSAVNATVWAQGAGHRYCLVNFNTAGMAIITLSTSFTGYSCISTSTDTVNVNSSISNSIWVTYVTGSGFLCNPSPTANTYQWGYDNLDSLNPTYLGEINPFYYNVSPDFANKLYWVISTNPDGCYQKAYYNRPAGVKNTNVSLYDEMKIYPNPSATGSFTIELPEAADKATIIISDVLGKTMLTSNWNNNTGTKIPVVLNDIAKGTYFIKVVTEGKTYTGRIVLR